MRDEAIVALLALSFAALVTVHASSLLGLAARAPRWHAFVALLVPPLAPYWAARSRMRLRAGLWIGSLAVYVVVLFLARR
jgi:hypothetical protein